LRVSSSGKLKRAKANRNHILTKKSARRKARLGLSDYVDAGDAPRLKRALGLK
jgi:large subunit ribosomal protein L35